MASGDALTPEELLTDLDRLRREARAARHAYWFPLVLFGLLTCASVPFYLSDMTQAGAGVAILRVTSPPTLLGGLQGGDRNGLLLAWYWVLALVAGYLLTYAWYRRHQRRAGIRTPARAFTITGIVLAAVAFLGPLLVADLPFRSGPILPPGDLWIRGTAAFLIAAAGLWVLAWAERSWALAIITLVYTGAALLASLYDVENVLYRLGWNPGYGSAGARLAELPNVLLPALVLLVAGAGAFLVRPRPDRA